MKKILLKIRFKNHILKKEWKYFVIMQVLISVEVFKLIKMIYN